MFGKNSKAGKESKNKMQKSTSAKNVEASKEAKGVSNKTSAKNCK